jgi:hypothetical protein
MDEIIKKNQFWKWSQIKKIVIKKIRTKFDWWKKFKGGWNWKTILIL